MPAAWRRGGRVDLASSRGPRDRNEDRLGGWLDGPASLLVVADGMGGYEAGDVAAGLVLTAVESARPAPGSLAALEEWMREVVLDAESRIQDHVERHGTVGMGSTVILASAIANTIVIAHVGDSRAYLVDPEEATLLTRDHTVGAEAVDRGVVTDAEVHTVPYHEALVRSLGALGTAGPEINRIPLPDAGGPYLLILCTDGVWNAVPSQDFPGLLFDRRGRPVPQPAEVLVREAVNRHTRDNATAVVLGLGPELEEPKRRRRLLVTAVFLLFLLLVGLPALLRGPTTPGVIHPSDGARPPAEQGQGFGDVGEARILWIRTDRLDGVEAIVGSNSIGIVQPGAPSPLRLLHGDSLLLRWGGDDGVDSMLVIVDEAVPDSLHVPKPPDGEDEN